ncbi:MAG: hypothetical protein C4K47_03245 [Candidatus Thorarchaeota archaeon]|nr:MAG: hypothetical protein C4K47_03245 [Candidatus Thorarchaeota archaeon]
MRKHVKLLLTGFCAPGFASIVYALRKSALYQFYVFSTDWKPNLAASFADKSEVIGDDLAPDWPDRIIESARREKIKVLVPIRTDDLAPLARNVKRLKEIGVIPTLPTENPELIQTMTNKGDAYGALTKLGISVPNHFRVNDLDSMREAAYSLGYPDVPVCVKPVVADGSRGFRILNEKMDKKRLFFQEKPSSVLSDLDSVCSVLGDEFPEMLVMEYLPGKEYTVDVLCREGTTYTVVPRLRTQMTAGISTDAVLSKDEHYGYICELSEKIVRGFRLSYNIGVQVREDRNGNPKILEINPRLQGTTIISVEGGVNIPELMVQMALGDFNPDYRPEIKWGLKLHRVYREIFELEGKVWTT